MQRSAVLLGALLCLGACVTTAPRSLTPGPGARTLEQVPLATFGARDCGPASLETVLAAWGRQVQRAELAAALPLARNGGVLTLDVVLQARALGFAAQLVEGTPELVTATLERGVPVIVAIRVVNAPGHRGDYFHYVVLDGVDPDRGMVRLQFGDGRRRWTTFERLDRPWRGTGRATIVIEPRQAAAPTEDPRLRYAVALEEVGEIDAAARLYEELLAETPSALLWTDLGNAERTRGRDEAAERAYRQAIALDPAWRDALNNLAWLLLEQGQRPAEAEELARRAVAADGPDPHLPLDTLARVLAARGDCAGAEATWRRALDLAPADSADRAALRAAADGVAAICTAAPD